MSEKREGEDIEFEPVDDTQTDSELIDGEATVQDKIKALREKVKASEQEKLKALEDLQRAKADFLNIRKRLEEQLERDKERQTNNFIESLTPLCDSFAMAMSNKDAWEAVDKNWRVGVESIYSQLQSLLREYKVDTINTTGVPFDPMYHEAVATTPVESEALHHTVVEVIQPGYERNSNGTKELIRPARVKVGEFTQQ